MATVPHGRRGVSNLISTTILLGLVLVIGIVAGSYIYSVIKEKTVSTRVVSFQGGEAFPDPSNSSVIVFSVYMKLLGASNVTISRVYVIYAGNTYEATCINCNDVNKVPPVSGDIIEYKFYAGILGTVEHNRKYAIKVEYKVNGRLESTNLIVTTS